jgi:hypothetical protein
MINYCGLEPNEIHVNWIQLAQDRVQRRDLVNMVTYLSVS